MIHSQGLGGVRVVAVLGKGWETGLSTNRLKLESPLCLLREPIGKLIQGAECHDGPRNLWTALCSREKRTYELYIYTNRAVVTTKDGD